ncbi:sugar phosphate isomerase/epimerase family protein [Anaerocolumna sp. MB42-C2]|uniref:sugar phosphate isomerase/epimerase family protein n=1 Tax=Anaerocolumna sp. MB42-C2 TaxID=3070997 RepID=UPI0027E06BC2|nr:TIM barrel protein [Anaerocolumna sp. MB42-C2]WMJ86696.1 TIM barrel protein [Anaerocolumna sp. MB42-C2]
MTGLTSVTFRQKKAEEIVVLAAASGLDGIEWGGDIHVPAGDREAARNAAYLTQSAGLKVLSYGSYYRLNQKEDFTQVLETAYELGAPNIRIWAGELSPKNADRTVYLNAEKELCLLCTKAQNYGIQVSLEYHRNTLTETAESTLKLIKLASCKNLRCYWQPNPDISHKENLRELLMVKPYLSNIHTFHWKDNNIRYPLIEGHSEWLDYIRIADLKPDISAYILEFVKDDRIDNFREDAKELIELLS